MKLHIYQIDKKEYTRDLVALLTVSLRIMFNDSLELEEVTKTCITATIKHLGFQEEDEYYLTEMLSNVTGTDNLTLILTEQTEEQHVA
jgi:hypothetical protein